MANELSKPFEKSALSEEDLYKMNKEKKVQITSFAFMIFLTFLAFIAVATEMVAPAFAVPFILVLAGMQFFLQMFYFMHLKDKGHEWANTFIIAGVVLSTPALIALTFLLGMTKY